jgi:hypothetical protein
MGTALELDSDKLAFIHGERAVVEEGTQPEKLPAMDRFLDKPEPAGPEPGPSRTRARRRGRRSKMAPPELLVDPEILDRNHVGDFPTFLVSLTTRLSPATAEALRRAALEQRLQRRRPHTQQEIVEAAVRHWLATNGFLRAT